MILTKKEGVFIKRLLSGGDYVLGAIDAFYCEQDNKNFKEVHGVTLKQALKIYDKFYEKIVANLDK